MKHVSLEIEGLNDVDTRERVTNQLEGVIGVKNVALSSDKTCIDVSYDEQTSQSELFSHLQNNGYKINT